MSVPVLFLAAALATAGSAAAALVDAPDAVVQHVR